MGRNWPNRVHLETMSWPPMLESRLYLIPHPELSTGSQGYSQRSELVRAAIQAVLVPLLLLA